MKKDHRRQFRVESARSNIKVDIVTTLEAVEQLALILEGELEQSVSTKWTQENPKINSINGTPKGKGKGRDKSSSRGKSPQGSRSNLPRLRPFRRASY
jgi:hypothetical protein